jgi:hypothetical protein
MYRKREWEGKRAPEYRAKKTKGLACEKKVQCKI